MNFFVLKRIRQMLKVLSKFFLWRFTVSVFQGFKSSAPVNGFPQLFCIFGLKNPMPSRFLGINRLCYSLGNLYSFATLYITWENTSLVAGADALFIFSRMVRIFWSSRPQNLSLSIKRAGIGFFVNQVLFVDDVGLNLDFSPGVL